MPQNPAPGRETIIAGDVDDRQALDAFLRIYAAQAHAPQLKAVVARTVDGGAAHPRITLVYLTDAGWCGSGGCALLVLEPESEGLRQLGRTTISRPPVRVLRTRTNGMPDLGVNVCGGGILECYEARLPFDGVAYASNPTVPPAEKPGYAVEGTVALSAEQVEAAFRR